MGRPALSVRVRPLDPAADIEPVNRMLLEAFPDSTPYGPRLREFHESGNAYTLIVEDAGTLLGMGTMLDYRSSGYVAHVGVDPRRQRGGIGRRVMEELLAESALRGHRYVELQATDAGFNLYLSLGFVLAGETFNLDGGATSGAAAGGAAATRADCAEVAALDAQTFGSDRTTTVERWFADAAATLVAVRDDGRLTGFAAARNGRIGPWLATSEDAAARALDALLELRPERMPIFAPAANAASQRMLASRGFAKRRRSRHMIYGAPSAPPRPGVYGLVTLSQG